VAGTSGSILEARTDNLRILVTSHPKELQGSNEGVGETCLVATWNTLNRTAGDRVRIAPL
jgi:arginine N-succinyltransferase